jgi:hypothetical protein
MTYCKPDPTPFQLGVRLEDVGASPLVDCTRYQQWVGSLLVVTGADPEFNASIADQQNPNQQPFRQQLQSR